MKRKIISFILLVVIMSSLLAVSAFAQPAVTIVTLNSGDTVFSLCQKYGVDYNVYKSLIMALNSVTDERQFGSMAVGSPIALPVSASAAAAISGSAVSAAPGATGSNSATPTPSPTPAVGAATSIPSGDTIACYIVSYTVKAGDTIAGIYADRDLSYKTYSNLILSLNDLSGFNKLRVGKTYMLPVSSVVTGDTVLFTVMSHIMKSGETVYGVVTTGYGLKFKDNQSMLKTINAKDDLGSFKVGEGLFIAVKGYVQPVAATPSPAPVA